MPANMARLKELEAVIRNSFIGNDATAEEYVARMRTLEEMVTRRLGAQIYAPSETMFDKEELKVFIDLNSQLGRFFNLVVQTSNWGLTEGSKKTLVTALLLRLPVHVSLNESGRQHCGTPCAIVPFSGTLHLLTKANQMLPGAVLEQMIPVNIRDIHDVSYAH